MSEDDFDLSQDKKSIEVTMAAKQAFQHMLISLFFLLFLCGSIYYITNQLIDLYAKINTLSEIQPENRFDTFEKKIDTTQKKVESDYADYVSKIEDVSITGLNDKFSSAYIAAVDSEKDYNRFLEAYLSSIYETAKNVRGSGVWYEYYNKELEFYIDKSNSRKKKLTQYLPISLDSKNN